MTTPAPFMPSIRGHAARPTARPRGTSTLTVVLLTLLGAATLVGLAFWLWPRSAISATPTDAGPASAPDAGTPPIIATRSPRIPRFEDQPSSSASSPPDAGPPAKPHFRPSGRGSTFSLRDQAEKDAARHPPPLPGALLCTMGPNTLIPLLGRMRFTTEVGEFRTLANDHRPCGGSIDLAIEHSPAGLVVNGLRFDGRPACFADFRSTVMELEDTPGRFYAAWILPEGGIIRACPDSQTLSTLSRKQRTPRQRSPRSPSDNDSSTPAATRPPWMPRSKSSSDDSSEERAWP